MKAERFVSVLLVVTLTGVIAGCQKAPEPAATQDQDEPAAPPPEPPARPAAPDVARPSNPAAGFRLPGTIVAVELRSLASVVDAASRVADTVQPGAGMMLGQVIAGAAGFDGYDAFRSGLAEKPATFLILNPKAHRGWLACAFGVKDGLELVAKMAKATGHDFREEPGGFSVEVRLRQRFFFRLVNGWAVGALGTEEGHETLDIAVEAVRAGAVPRAPAFGDHVAVHVDMVELRRAFGAEIDQGLAQMRTMLGANPLVKQSPAFGRLMQEYAAALGAIVKGFDGLAVSLKISPEAVEITQRVRPAAGSVFEPVALRPRRAAWTVADVLPPEAPVAIVMRIDQEALRPLGEALVKGVVRAASGGEPDAAKIDEVLGLFSKVVADGTEFAFAVTGYSPLGPMGVGAATTDFETYRVMQKETAGFLSLFDELWKALGLRMKFEYQADVGRLGGRPVDRTVTSIEPEAAGPNAAVMAQALAQFGGQTETVAEFVGTPAGVVYATGKEPRKLLEEAAARRRESAGFRGTGWASASPALRKLLERAPERTWCAGEVRLGAYFAMALKSVAKNLPIKLPDTAVLTGNDPPLAFWVAADGGEIVSRGRLPVVSVKNLVTFFTQLGMQFRPPAGDEDFEFKDEGFDDGGEVW